MAGESYYFLFSLILVLGVLLILVNLLLIRTKGKTTFGIAHEPGTPEYRKGIEFASTRNIAIATIIALILIANLTYDVNRLLHLDGYPRGILPYIAGFVVLMFGLMIPVSRRLAGIISRLGTDKKRK